MNNRSIAQTNSLENRFAVKGSKDFYKDIDINDPSIPVIGYGKAVEDELKNKEAIPSFILNILDLKPCNHQLLVGLLYEGVTKAGIHLSDEVALSKVKGIVIAVDEAIAINHKIPANVRGIKKGDIVIFPPRAYQEVNEPGQESSGIVLVGLPNILATYTPPDDSIKDKE